MPEKYNSNTQPQQKSRRWLLYFVSIVTLLGLAKFFCVVRTAMAQTTTIKINPALITINGCETVDVYVRIENVANLYGAETIITFDPDLLEVVSLEDAVNGLADPILIMPLGQYFYIYKDYDNNSGLIRYAMTHLNPAPEGNGDGNLLLIRFRAKAANISLLSYSSAKLAAPGGIPITATSYGGATNAIAPTFPNNFTIGQLSATAARLTWDSVSGIDDFLFYRENDAPYFTPNMPWQTLPNSTTHYDDTVALGSPNTNHYYQLTTVCQNGFESGSAGRLGEFDFEIVPGNS